MTDITVSEIGPGDPVVEEVLIVLVVEGRHYGHFWLSIFIDDLLLSSADIELLEKGIFFIFGGLAGLE